MVNFETLQMPPQNTNSVVVSCGGKCAIFDPWGHEDNWVQWLKTKALIPVAIYITHGHPDHIAAAPKLAKKFNIPWYLHNADFRLVGWGNDLLEYFGLAPISIHDVRPTQLPQDMVQIMDGISAKIIETPGHTPGGVAYYFEQEKKLIVGDTIFQDAYGRCDLPGGSEKLIMNSIHKIHDMNLPDDVAVIHGHGMNTTIGYLQKNNPFFK